MLHEWHRQYVSTLLTALSFSRFYFYQLRIYNDYFFALRRFVPVILPCLLAFAAYFLSRMAAAGGGRRLMAGGIALGLGGRYLVQVAPVVRYVDWEGSVRLAAGVARPDGPAGVVIL